MKRFRYPSATVIIVLLGLTLSINSFAQPSNNECSAAITLTSNTSCVNTAGTNVNATWNPTTFPGATIGCGAIDKLDVWYKFVAQSSSQTITISSAPSQIRLQLLSGTCGSFTSIACGITSIAATGLIVGNTYYIRVYTQNNKTGTFNICVTHAPPVNDNCAGAISLTSNTSCINTASTLNSATANGATPLNCFAADTYYDVWFSFVAAHTTETITISSLGASITNPQIQLYGGTCAGLTNLSACGGTSITQSGLTVGTTYYVRVANRGTNPSGAGSVADFNICVTHVPPANDNCSGAISLTSGTSCVNTAGTLAGATYTAIPTIGCGVASRNDIWYSFVAQSTSPTITLSSAPANPRLQLFSGTCGALTSVACSVTGTLVATGLTIGNTYFIRVYTDPNASGTFNICITDPAPPANDNCAGAISLTSATSCVTTAGTLDYATYTAIPTIGCGVANRNDVWYSFVAQSTNPTITLYSAFANPRIQLFSGTCGALTSITCGISSLTASGLTIGNTYLVRVYTDPNVSGIFNICITDPIPPVPPANDNCAGAISIASGIACSNTAGTLITATATTGLPVGCESVGTHYDVWYKFIAVSTTETVAISSLGSNITTSEIQLYSGACGALTSLACHANSITQGGLTVGATYYVRVSNIGSSPSSNGGFNICVTHTGLVNDNCANAIILTSGYTCSYTTGTVVGSTVISGSTSCGGGPSAVKYDVWYSFIAQSTSPTITLNNVGINFTSPKIEIFSVSCAGSAVFCNTISPSVNPTLVIGTTYYVRIFSTNGSAPATNGNFDICITDPSPPTPPSNDACSGATLLNSSTTCGPTAGTLAYATISSPAVASTCGTPGADTWYFFVAQTAYPTITLNNIGASVGTSYIQLFSGSCGSFTSLACVSGTGTSLSLNTSISPGGAGLTIGAIYYVRIYSPTVSPAAGSWGYDICVTDPPPPPANDDCSGAISLPANSTTCTNTAGTLASATTSNPAVASTCGGTPGADVWYSFVAQSPFPTIALSAIGTSIQSGTAYIQLFSGTCGSLTSLSCVSGTAATLSLLPGGTGLTIGNTYYVRIYTSTTSPTGSNLTFNICITNPGTSSTAAVEFSKSYINVTKLATGGAAEPGDILEIRATFILKSGVVDSVAFYDTLQVNSGFTLVPGSLATQTNEGKLYEGFFTNASDADAGTVSTVPSTSDVAIKTYIETTNAGVPVARGTITAGNRPRFSGTTIIMATYLVQVNASYDSKIDWGGGAFVYRDKATGNMRLLSFKSDSLVVYANPGLCSSSLSANNQVGIETNGTFAAASGPTPLARNRGTSTAVPSYTYAPFGPPTGGGGPNDYYYGIANNTSGNTYTASNVFPKQTLGSAVPERVFALWDIIGDHTGATNTAKGNPPCNINLPVSATNPCGYMLVVNAAYKTDTAFRSTITNLCPNTYYELSAWVRNVCAKCGQDSTGKGAASAAAATPPTYIPLAQGDSSGVPPNLAFQINGQDYYTTGNIYYTGTDVTGNGDTTQYAQDTLNQWVKRGFVYKTGPSQTGFEFLIRNNAPGGGGNDWAIDDIVVATCSPEVTVTPGPNPFVCDTNTVDVGAIIASYYDNYTYYKWEKSDDYGATWTSTGVSGSITPTWNGSAWAYNVSYPTFVALPEDSGSKYRVLIASTASNLTSPSCSFSGGATVTLNVNPCDFLLNVGILSFKGRNENNQGVLYWTTSKEQEPVKYEIQKSKDGSRFVKIGEITGYKDPSAETNHYTYVDPELLDNTLSWYRIKAINTQDNKFRYSKVVQLIGDKAGLQIESLINPFNSHVKFDLISGDDGLVQVEILDQYQHKLKSGSYNLVKGRNRINIDNTDKLPAGFYILRVISDNNVINRKIIKRG
jgi:hypothetical protein